MPVGQGQLSFSIVFLCGLTVYALFPHMMKRFCALPFFFSGLSTAYAKVITPKVVIVDFYNDEANIWHGIPEFDLLAHNISVPGLSSMYPHIHCTSNGEICQLITDEGEINAAASTTAFVLSPMFNLTSSYFLLAGDAGINPKVGTLASVAFARFSVQVALQYEFDARERPEGSPTGYIPQGTTGYGQYPGFIYGTEVFELNDALRRHAIGFARRATLNDSASAQAYRETYASEANFLPALLPPSVLSCDTATSDVWFSGDILADTFENTMTLFTNGSSQYCTTQQEDSGVLAALVRANVAGLVDFTRVMSMRTASDFDRPAPNQTAADNLFNGQDAGYDAAVMNIYLAGVQVVQGILGGWNHTFADGVKPQNYVGDIRQTLNSTVAPDFGPAPDA